MPPSTFPILRDWQDRKRPGGPRRRSVPWALVAPHSAQAWRNHDQTLERLAERGGLDPAELVAVLLDRRWQAMDPAAADAALEELVAAHERAAREGLEVVR